jgi:AAA+ superfamily predicted ATPase
LTVMCTNRANAIDPAVRRRAAAVLTFRRPEDADREAILQRAFAGVTINATEMDEIVRLTGPAKGTEYGCTYSDLRQRFIPSAVLQSIDAGLPITGRQLIEIATTFVPTRPFESEQIGD